MNTVQIVVGSVVGAIVVASVLGTPAVAQENSSTIVLTQGDESVRVTPVGDGSRSVEAFYDYRSPATEPTGQYSSYGTQDIQIDQVSQLFIYHGRNGLSLVFLHDKHSDRNGGGAVITADISGLPESGNWAVEDDTYDERDDVFQHGSESSHIEWLMNGHRTDGAAYRGLEQGDNITVDMRFNEQSENYPFEEWEGPPEQNEIERWIVRSGDGETTTLDMDEPVEISVESGDRQEPTTDSTDSTSSPATTHDPGANPPTPDGAESGVTGPGFGVVPAIIALVALTTLLFRRYDG